jgi:hypothetical protein
MPFARHFARKADGERVDGGLRRRVVDVLARRTQLRRTRRHVGDCAAGAAVGGRHASDRFARAKERARHVGGEHPRKASGVHLLDARLLLDDARVVDKRVDRSQLRVDGLEQPDDIGFHGDVRRGRNRPPARPLDVRHDAVRGFLIRAVIDADRVAALGGEPRSGRADAAAAAGDQKDLRHDDMLMRIADR